MIGVLADKRHLEIVTEFFELFKTPWEFYNEKKRYDVIVCTSINFTENTAKLNIIYNKEETLWDNKNGICVSEKNHLEIIDHNGFQIPIYGKSARLSLGENSNDIQADSADDFIARKALDDGTTVIRVGYDLFEEIEHILHNGQPKEYAYIPTIDLHIQLLRNWIIEAELPLIEIPPVPAGYDFMCCLTHDVDFAGIRNHLFDRTMFGFLYRALFKSFIQFVKGQKKFKNLLRNWVAVLKLPFIHLGLADDFWVQFDSYRKIEDGLSSTFYFIPFENRPGQLGSSQAPDLRACKYKLESLKKEISKLRKEGCEVGLHGIDAWHDAEKAVEEKQRIVTIVGNEKIGVRMHWLYFNKESAQILERVDLQYDSSLGYNDAVGYRNGTTQPFRLRGTKKLMELPLNIQDTSMFYTDRIGLTEEKAFEVCKNIIDKNEKLGGTLVINWHHRSIFPERLWDNFYSKILAELNKYNVWFARAGDAVKWFEKRRSVLFENTKIVGNNKKIKLSGNRDDELPGPLVRVYRSCKINQKDRLSSGKTTHYFDIPLDNKEELKISL